MGLKEEQEQKEGQERRRDVNFKKNSALEDYLLG